MTFVKTFDDPGALDASSVGGKGANLAKLSQAGAALGFDVPGGFVVTQEAHETVLFPVKGLIRRLAKIPETDHAGLARASKALTATLLKAPFDSILVRDIRRALKALRGPVAVRSSATCEDSSAAAFAGQHDTFLNVTGEAAILEAIAKCFASLYAPQAVIYRRQAGVKESDAQMAVVIQQMAACDRAGVAFAMHPVSGALNQSVINANYGLGESVVSGETLVDQFVVDRDTDEIIERDVAAKTMRVVCNNDGIEELTGESDSGPCLGDKEILAISDLTERVSRFMGYPQDIEWGIAEERLVLFQARPITRLPERLTRDESAERFPSPVTPMTWGLVEDGFHRSLRASFALMDLPAYDGKWFTQKDNYIYGNQTVVELYHKLAAEKTMGFDFTDDGLKALALKIAGIDRFARDWQVNLERFLGEIAVLGNAPLDELDVKERWDHVEAVNASCVRFFEPNIAISLFHTGISKALAAAVELLVGEDDAARLIEDLKAGVDTRTGYVNRELLKLAAMVKADAALGKLLKNFDAVGRSAEGLIEAGVFRNNQQFESAFAAFVADFGHREVDFDPYHAPWGDAPEVLLAQISAMAEGGRVDVSDEGLIEKHAEDKARAFMARQKLILKAPAQAAFVLGEMIDLVCLFEELDDLEHYSTSRVTRPVRRALLAVGQSLVNMDVLNDPSDVWMINPDLMRETLSSDAPFAWSILAEEVRAAKELYEKACKTEPEWEPGARLKAESLEESETVLCGLPGSAGQVEGEVYVLESGADFKNFPKGAILVARTTSPAWTPLFYSASAVITASGGPLSHGAVTAREVGIPAVMSVKSALTKLYNGLRVRVDGTSGRIELLGAIS